MKVNLVEMPVQEDVLANLAWLKAHFPAGCDVVVLPELWNCVYENTHIRAAAAYGKLCHDFLADLAKCHKVWIAGGTIPFEANGKIYNRCFVFDREGREVCQYSKMHLMELETGYGRYSEADVFTAGNELVTFSLEGILCGIQVCYDIRMPEPSRLLALAGVKVLFVPGAFNHKIGFQWHPLLQARAIENQIYVAGCAPDYAFGNYQSYGHSVLYDPMGREAEEIDPGFLDNVRKRMPVWKIRRSDKFEVEEL